MKKYKQKDYSAIPNNIIEHATLVQIMGSIGNANNDISVVGYWIFDSNYEKALVLNRELLNIICALSVGEEQFTKFETVFYAVR